ncbi:MAG: hypothetical protein KGY48_00940 [Wenzhouxiangellaceae bacterium]|nr:hypothetical protein [Wenzhouxiangellaceae bacterium]MBS3745826.1 hypothetical protein [Wenzhouxiangellaceae bacterium]MBS3823873.1 hypothetical protein [Wenzhouxiangellaceae bacterium]
MKPVLAISLMTLFLAAGAGAQDSAAPAPWHLEPPEKRVESPLASIFRNPPLGFDQASGLGERPRLTVSLSPRPSGPTVDADSQAFSWSLDAWEINTASLAHIQCSRATRTIESFLVEDCRFVDQPLPQDSANLIQVQGRWMAAPGLSFGAGAYSGRQPIMPAAAAPVFDPDGSGRVNATGAEQIEGLNMNVSFGLSMGQVGSLLLDLQLERYRQTPEPLSQGLQPAGRVNAPAIRPDGNRYGNAGQLGLAWRGGQFGADVTGQYQELPYWMGEQLEGEGFRSFDIELSWRAPFSSSISVGVSNILDRLPSAANSADQGVEEAVDGIYGRIPYVRYKHDL